MSSTAPAAPATFRGRFGEYRIPDGPIRLAGETADGLWYHKANGSTGILRVGIDTVSATVLPSHKPSSGGDCPGPKGAT